MLYLKKKKRGRDEKEGERDFPEIYSISKEGQEGSKRRKRELLFARPIKKQATYFDQKGNPLKCA